MATDTYAQVNRLLTLDSPAGEKLLPVSFTAAERVSGLFNTQLEIVAERADAASIVPEEIVGKKMTLQMAITSEYEGSPRRYINGMVSRFSQGHSDRRFVHYRAEVVPWLWLMTLASGCRIFQEMTVLDIIQKVFDEFKGHYPELVAYRVATTKDYTKFDYCVQYRETAFNFVSRLMEEEGILYFFEHEKDKHTLVLADNPAAHKPCPNQPTGQYVPEGGVAEADNPVLDWQVVHELRSGKYTLRDFHFQMPSKSLEVVEPTKFEIAGNSKLEIYDYPGEYAQRFNNKDRQGEVEPEATKLVKVRMEEQETLHAEIQGDSLCRGFLPGYAFKLAGHSNRKMNGDYVLTEVRHAGVQTPSYVAEGTGETAGEPYRNTFTCISAEMLFTPPRTTPQPVVQGPQTAMVVGPAGEEIYTDEFSRVKVQFHWDREGKRDENSSCWVRVSQPWAGQGWGSVSVPRIGQEVVVNFVEGDPNHPLIVGRLYNAESMPPYALPDSGMVSGLKSNSTPGGGGYNEISMNDTKGKEMITVHGQYDMSTVIEHDETAVIHNNRSMKVDVDHTESVGNNQSITVGVNQTLDVGSNQTNTIGASQTSSIGANRDTTIAANDKTAIGANEETNIGVGETRVVGATRSTTVGATDELSVGVTLTITAGAQVSVTAGAGISLTVGASNVTITPAGVTIAAPMIKLN
jgi:type VI secretion system secreted protein VgrG